MKIRLLDDLHTEFGSFDHQFEQKADVCLLAGDIGTAPSVEMLETIVNIGSQHELTVLVPGNHEYYSGEYYASNYWMNTTLKQHCAGFGVRLEVFAPHGFVEFDGVPIVGGTLWTDFNGGDPMDMLAAGRRMNDFQQISVDSDDGMRRWTTRDALEQCLSTRRFLEAKLDELKNPRTVIVTHHAPFWDCTEEQFRSDRLTSAYCNTGLEPWFFEKEFNAWCHGHCHNSNRLSINDRRVFSNARGYAGYALNHEFDPEFVFEV